MKQDNNGIVYFATKEGILQYDGRNWDLIEGDGPVYTLQITPDGNVYWGGANGFGTIGYSDEGNPKTKLLSKSGVKNIFQSLTVNDNVYFLNYNALYEVGIKSSSVSEISATSSTGSFGSVLELFGHLYVDTELAGIMAIEKTAIHKSDFKLPNNSAIIFTNKINDTYLIGASDDRIYRYNKNLKLQEIIIQDGEYIKAGVVTNGNWINSNLIALSTLRGGVVFINPNTGNTEEIVNYNTGLPDNEVFAIMNDHNQNLWIAHDYGFTRVSPYMPLHSFSHYNGLQGNLLCAISYQHQVYVGTSLGLFRLEKQNKYEDIEYYVNVKIPTRKNSRAEKKKPANPNQDTKVVASNTTTTPTEKKGFLWFLRKDKTKAIVQTQKSSSKNPLSNTSTNTVTPGYRQERRTQKVLRSTDFIYKKISGIDAKVTQLIEVNGELLSAGLDGVHEIRGSEATPILEEPVRFLYSNSNVSLVSTYGGKMHSLSFADNNWRHEPLFNNLSDEINYIFKGAGNELWLTSFDQIYKLDLQKEKKLIHVDLPGANIGESVGVYWNNEIIIATNEGFFKYNAQNKFIKIDSLPKPKTFFTWANTIFYRDDHSWKSIGASLTGLSNLKLLNIFQDMRFLAVDQRLNSLWLITGNNELYRFFGQNRKDYESSYPLLLKTVRNGNKKLNDFKNLEIDERESAISFEVSQPDYVGVQAIEYRYLLEGLNNEWSDWSSGNNITNFPYLPPGKYTFKVQSKNIFDELKNMKAIALQVQPPYWQRLWFYALEFVFFGSLVLLSLRLSTRYIIVSRILSLLTIILLIQFIQTIVLVSFASTSSPVLDFFVQVLIALMILPVEGYLRKLMLKSHDQSVGLRQLITSKIKGNIDNKSS